MVAQTSLKVSADYIEYILNNNQAIMGHLYKFTSPAGAIDTFTDLDVDINWGGYLWKSGGLRFSGMRRKISIGLQVDQQQWKIWAQPSDTLYGANFLANAQIGLLDGTFVQRYRIVWANNTGNAAASVAGDPLACWILFSGYTADISAGGATHVDMKIKSPLNKLEVNIPRNYWQPGCNWTLFSTGCTLLKSAYAVNGVIGAGATKLALPIQGGVSPNVGPDGYAYYQRGRLLFTSGANQGLLTLINWNDSVNLYLAYRLNSLPVKGDTVTFYPGCSKKYHTCDVKFNNKNNFRGFDKVPPVVISL